MKCPMCEVALFASDRLGSRVWCCPECSGEWLGNGVVERLMSLSRKTVRVRKRQIPIGMSPRDQRVESATMFEWF